MSRRIDEVAAPLGVALDIERRTMLERMLLGTGVAGAALFGGAGVDLLAAGQAAGAGGGVGISMAQGVRRIITGHNAQGKSYIITDDRVAKGTFPNLYKATGEMPLGPGPAAEPHTLMPTDAPNLEPALGGSSLNFVTLPPSAKGAKPGWHRTMTLDYNVMLGGEMVLMVDEGETKIFPGDVVIQRNTLHAWRNDTTSPVYWVAVLVPIRKA
jgi:hypothetical protein